MSPTVMMFRLIPVLVIVAIAVTWSFPLLALGSRFGLWGYQSAFMMIGGAAITAAIILALAGFTLLLAIRGGNQRPLHRSILVILILSIPIGVLFSYGIKGSQAPVIHDVSTDWTNPPQYINLENLRAEGENPLQSAEEVRALQEEFYPGIQPLIVAAALPELMVRIREVADRMGWMVLLIEPEKGFMQSVATTFWFGFKDDVVVRVTDVGPHQPGHLKVDVRSSSRVGKSDLGKNAERIDKFLKNLQ